MFIAQGNPKAPVTHKNMIDKIEDHVERASVFQNIIFWTPEQLCVLDALQILFICLDAFYSTGKSTILQYVANHWSNETGKF